MKWDRIVVIVGLILLLGSLGLLFGGVVTEAFIDKDKIAHQIYSGRLLASGEEYKEFKSFLVDNLDVDIIKLQSLSSEESLVIFTVQTYKGKEFPWGEVTWTAYTLVAWKIVLIIIIGGAGVLILAWANLFL